MATSASNAPVAARGSRSSSSSSPQKTISTSSRRSFRHSKQGNMNRQIAIDTARGVGKKLGSTALEVGKSVLASPIRVGSSILEAPRVYRGGKPFKPFKVPGLGEVKTYAREASDKVSAGSGSKSEIAEAIIGTGSKAILDTAAIGSVANQVFNPGGKTTALTNAIKKVSPKTAAKWDQLTYRPYRGAPQGWQLKMSEKLKLPFWKMNLDKL